jgi:hypothetical protein
MASKTPLMRMNDLLRWLEDAVAEVKDLRGPLVEQEAKRERSYLGDWNTVEQSPGFWRITPEGLFWVTREGIVRPAQPGLLQDRQQLIDDRVLVPNTWKPAGPRVAPGDYMGKYLLHRVRPDGTVFLFVEGRWRSAPTGAGEMARWIAAGEMWPVPEVS